MRIRFDSNDDDLLYYIKILSTPVLIIVIKSAFQHDNKYYSQIHINECGYEL